MTPARLQEIAELASEATAVSNFALGKQLPELSEWTAASGTALRDLLAHVAALKTERGYAMDILSSVVAEFTEIYTAHPTYPDWTAEDVQSIIDARKILAAAPPQPGAEVG